MSFQRPIINTSGPSTASYSEFLKDIYSSLRALTTGLNGINQQLDTLTQQLKSFDARLANQDQMTLDLSARIDTLIQRTETQQIRQTTNGLSLLSELDNLGSREVEPSTGLVELGQRTAGRLPPVGLSSKFSFQLTETPDKPDNTFGLPGIPDIIIHEASPTNGNSYGHEFDEPSRTATADTTTTANINTNPVINSEPVDTKPQLGLNFLILD